MDISIIRGELYIQTVGVYTFAIYFFEFLFRVVRFNIISQSEDPSSLSVPLRV